MPQLLHRICSEKKGQSMVELALILPLILFLLLGVVEFGRMFHSYLVVTQGSREGARLAVVGESDQAVAERVGHVTSTLDVTKIRVTVTPAGRDRIRGVPVDVTVRYQLDLMIPNFFQMFPDPFIISSTTTMRME